ncbi:hypothetical protein ACFPIF_11945 [Brevundimonas faecalis]|uniref:hypothetical protein n=1 Tax=Brevundimonas faecalis TaxID=947378 RepID=UPI00362059A8
MITAGGVGSMANGWLGVPDTPAEQWSVADHVRAGVSGAIAGSAGAGVQSLIDGSSFGDNLKLVLPSVIGNTLGGIVAKQLTTPPVQGKDKGLWPATVRINSETGQFVPDLNRYFVEPNEFVGGGQPATRRGFLERQYDRFLKPIVDPIKRAGRSFAQSFMRSVDFTREPVGATYASLSDDVTQLADVVVTGAKQTPKTLQGAWNDFFNAWSLQPSRPRGFGETTLRPSPPSNLATWFGGDIGLRQSAVRDIFDHAAGVSGMRSVTRSNAANAGLTVRAALERAHGGFASTFATPYGVIDTVLGRPAAAIGLRWNSPQNVSGHMMAEPAITVASVFVGGPKTAAGMAPRAAAMGPAEVREPSRRGLMRRPRSPSIRCDAGQASPGVEHEKQNPPYRSGLGEASETRLRARDRGTHGLCSTCRLGGDSVFGDARGPGHGAPVGRRTGPHSRCVQRMPSVGLFSVALL